MLNKNFTINNFDILRLLAATQVLLFHSITHLNIKYEGAGLYIFRFLSMFPGVPVFFVISGFLISKSLKNNKSLTQYGINRVLRIYPAVWICLAVSLFSVASSGFWGKNIFQFGSFTKWIIPEIIFGHTYHPAIFKGFGIGKLNGSLWTIPIELQFYIVLPLIYMSLKRLNHFLSNLIIFFLILLSSFIASKLVNYNPATIEKFSLYKMLEMTVIPYLYMFLIGVFIQRNYLFFRNLLENKAIWWLFFYILSATLLKYFTGISIRNRFPNIVIYLILAFTIISCAFSFRSFSNYLLKGYDLSYGIYIYHMVIVNILVEFGFSGTKILLIFVLLLSYGCSLLSWLYVEKPMLKLKKLPLRHV